MKTHSFRLLQNWKWNESCNHNSNFILKCIFLETMFNILKYLKTTKPWKGIYRLPVFLHAKFKCGLNCRLTAKDCMTCVGLMCKLSSAGEKAVLLISVWLITLTTLFSRSRLEIGRNFPGPLTSVISSPRSQTFNLLDEWAKRVINLLPRNNEKKR